MREAWVLSILNQCRKANIPFFFKQWGGTRKKDAGRTLRGKTYDEFPPFKNGPIVKSVKLPAHSRQECFQYASGR